MSTGGDNVNIGSASIRIGGDLADLDKALASAASKIQASQRSIQGAFKSASAAVAAAEVRRLNDAYRNLEETYKAVIVDTTNLSNAQRTLVTTTTAATRGTEQVGRGGRNSAMGLLALSGAIDDLQYGFRAIVNNIPMVVYMMGGSAGLAGIIGIAAVAVNQLTMHWGQLMSMFGNTVQIDKTKRSLEELRGEIDRLKAGGGFPLDIRALEQQARKRADLESRIEAQGGLESSATKAQTEAVREAIGEVGPERDKMVQQIFNMAQKATGGKFAERFWTPEQRLAFGMAKPGSDAERKVSEEGMVTAQKRLEELSAEAEKSAEALALLSELARVAGMPKLAETLRLAGPEGRRAEAAREYGERGDEFIQSIRYETNQKRREQRRSAEREMVQQILSGPQREKVFNIGPDVGGGIGTLDRKQLSYMVRQRAQATGVTLTDEAAQRIVTELRERLAKAAKLEISEVQNKYGVNHEEARQILSTEAQLQNLGARRAELEREMEYRKHTIKAEFVNPEDYFRRLTIAGAVGPEKEQLRKLDTQIRILQNIEAKLKAENIVGTVAMPP